MVGQLLKQGREFGIQVVVGVSLMHYMSDIVRNNISNFFVLAQNDYRPRERAARMLRLESSDEHVLERLQAGQAVAKFNLTSWPDPMIMQVRPFPPNRAPRLRFDRSPHAPGKSLNDLPAVHAELLRMIEKRFPPKKVPAQPRATQPSKSNRADSGSQQVSDLAQRFLSQAAQAPGDPVVRLWERIGESRHTIQSAVRQELTAAKLAVYAEVRIRRTKMLLVELTQAGWNRVNQPCRRLKGRGNLVHRTMSDWVRRWLEQQGRKPSLEWEVPGSGHPVDVAARRLDSGQFDVWEVVSKTDDNLADHVRDCLMNGALVASVTIVTAQKTNQKPIERQLSRSVPPELLKRVHWELIDTYGKDLGLCVR